MQVKLFYDSETSFTGVRDQSDGRIYLNSIVTSCMQNLNKKEIDTVVSCVLVPVSISFNFYRQQVAKQL